MCSTCVIVTGNCLTYMENKTNDKQKKLLYYNLLESWTGLLMNRTMTSPAIALLYQVNSKSQVTSQRMQ